MANKINPKRSYLPGVAPTSAEMGSHECAINWADKILYVKSDDGGITSIAIGGPYTLPTASSTVLGGIKIGANLTITNGVLTATGGSGTYTLPTATSSVLGGIKVGANLTITDGVLAATGGGGGTDSRFDLFLPPAPTSVSATAGNAQAVVSWTAPTGVIAQAPITGYVVEWTPSGGSASTTSTGSTSTSYTKTGLTNGTAYTFRVAAVNGIGTGAFSTASAAVTPVAVTPDPYFAQVALLLPMDGTGNTFIDSSGTPKNVTANPGSGVTQSTAETKFGDKSAYFGAEGDYLSFPDLGIGTGDFVIEMHLKSADTSSYRPIMSNMNSGVGFALFLNYGGDGIISLQLGASQIVQSSGVDCSDNQWHYIAVSRSGSTVRLYVDGTLVSTGTSSATLTSAVDTMVARDTGLPSSYNLTGYIDDLRITVGSARTYTGGTIAVPAAAFPTS